MYKQLLIAVFLLAASNTQAQRDSLYAELRVTSFAVGEDTVHLATPKQVLLRNTGCSEIVSFGKFGDLEFGIQFELLNCDMDNTSAFITGQAFYARRDGDWILIGPPGHYAEAPFRIIPGEPANNPGHFTNSTVGMPAGNGKPLLIKYQHRYLFYGKRLF